jgi:uncharacterized membrane protein YkoI
MNLIQKSLGGVAALAALGLGGAAIAGAAGGNGSTAPVQANDAPDQEIAASVEQQAGDAAVASIPGGTVKSVENADEGGTTAYEVKVTDPSGKVMEVGVSKTFTVTKTAADDNQNDGETADDHGQKGDGDGETADDQAQSTAQDPTNADGETADDGAAATASATK